MDSNELIEAQDRSRSERGRRSEVEQALMDATMAAVIARARFFDMKRMKPATRTEYWEDYKVKASEYEEAVDLFMDDYRQKMRRGEVA